MFFFRPIDTFYNRYKVFSYTSARPNKKSELNASGKILLPNSTLLTLSQMNITFPITFQIQKYRDGSVTTHCGVLEFTANEGQCIIPEWLMKRLKCKDGEYVELRTVNLPKAQFIKLKPEKFEFFEIPNYKTVMEKELNKYSILTVGDDIVITFNKKEYVLNVSEVKPGNRAVNIVETDVTVDFDGNHFPQNQSPNNSLNSFSSSLNGPVNYSTNGMKSGTTKFSHSFGGFSSKEEEKKPRGKVHKIRTLNGKEIIKIEEPSSDEDDDSEEFGQSNGKKMSLSFNVNDMMDDDDEGNFELDSDSEEEQKKKRKPFQGLGRSLGGSTEIVQQKWNDEGW